MRGRSISAKWPQARRVKASDSRTTPWWITFSAPHRSSFPPTRTTNTGAWTPPLTAPRWSSAWEPRSAGRTLSARFGIRSDSVSQGKVLWSGVWFGSSGSALLAEPLSAQKNGILLVWSAYEDNEAKDWSWVYTFVPRWHAVAPTGTHGIVASAVNVDFVMAKYLYVCDEKIDSYPANEQTISVGGITVENWRWALRCVLGV